MLSTTLGVGVFLLFVTFSAHVLLNLWLASTLDAVGQATATRIALGSPSPDDERRAVADARSQLGRFGDRVRIDVISDPEGEQAVVRIRTEGLSLVPDVLGVLDGIGAIDRRYPVRLEVPR